jgi:hypothetical protein
MTVRRMTSTAVLTAAAMLVATAAAAQGPPGATPGAKPGPKRAKEFLVGGVLTGPTSVGSAAAELLDGAGDPSVTWFRVNNALATGAGIESNIGVQIGRALWMEVSGGFTRSSVRSEIRDDFEDAFDVTASSSMSRFTVEGGVLRYFRDRGTSAWFVRVSGGWMRETAGGNTLTGDGVIAGGGVGLRRWWRTNGKGAVKRVGLRLEGRADIRSGGISLGKKGVRFGPAGAVHFVFGR